MIVDAHVHVGRWPELGLNFTLQDLEAIMTEYGYSGAVVMPMLVGVPLLANIELRKEIEGKPRLYMFAWVGPYNDSADLVDWIGANIGGDVKGMKFHASISQCEIGDACIQPFLEIADHAGLPFLYHAGRTPISWPVKLMTVAPSYPNVKFILGHGGGTAYDRAVDTLHRWPSLPSNVWVEISTQRWPDLMCRMVKTWGEDRILFGTDLPFTDQRLNFDCLRYAGLLANEKFMGGNLLRLLKSQ